MKRIIYIIMGIAVLLAAAFLIYQNRPIKRYYRHVLKARMFLQEKKLEMARAHYFKAYSIKDGYTPWVSMEVLELENTLLLREEKTDSALKNIQSFISTHKNTKDGRIMLATLAFKSNRPDIAFNAIEEVLALDPLNFEARFLLSRLRLSQGRPDLAEEEIRILYDAYPDSAAAIFPLAKVLIDQGKFMESKRMLAGLKEKPTYNKRASLLLIDIYAKEGKLDSIIAELDNWTEDDTTLRAEVDLRKARLYSMTNKLEKAGQILKNYSELKEENIVYLVELAVLNVKQGNLQRALEIYEKVKELDSDLRLPISIRSQYLLLSQGKAAKSLELAKSVYIKIKSPEVVKQLIIAHLALDQKHKALEFIETLQESSQPSFINFLQELEPDQKFLRKLALFKFYQSAQQNSWVHKTTKELYKTWPRNTYIAGIYARQLASLKRPRQAVQVLERLPKPSLQNRSLMLAYYFRTGLDAKALALSRKMLKTNPKLKGIQALMGLYYLEKKQTGKACDYFEKELALDPVNLVALNNLAWQYGVVEKNFEKAKPHLDALTRTGVQDPRVLDTQGWIYTLNGRFAEADSVLTLSINLLPDHPTILYHAAYLKAKQGNKDQSRKLLEKALGSKQKFNERKDAEKLLQSL